MDKNDIKEWLSRFNERIDSAFFFSYPVRDKELQSEEIDSLGRFLNELESQRIAHHKAKNADLANLFLGMCCFAQSMLDLLQMWLDLRSDAANEAWDSLIGAQDSARAAIRAHQICANNMMDYVEYLENLEKILFPPQTFVSSSFLVKKSDCSICNAPFHGCDHIAGFPYNGVFCTEVVRDVSEIEHVAIVECPDDKRCRATAFCRNGIEVDSFTLRRTQIKEGGSGSSFKATLMSSPEQRSDVIET